MTPKEIVEELFRRRAAGDDAAVDELVAEDLVNHAAGPQGRAGWKQIIATIENDLGQVEIEHHHLIAEGDLVAHHMTMSGTHQASTMPLLAGAPVTNAPVAWTYIHLWRIADGRVVEHWACRDDVGLLRQVGAWPPNSPV
ncbi:MAG TPA: ester cyclase [Acidimicrobiales bacterium]|jgi:lactoylglutathione lyase|nr:ester cyclase [Acidimicrobiales bacterium]